LASATLNDALQRLVRYVRIVNTGAQVVLDIEDEYVHLVFSVIPKNREFAFEAVDASIAVLVSMCTTSYGADFHPFKISMTRPKPPCPDKFSRYFKCPVSYSESLNTITFRREDIDLLLPTSNAELALTNNKVVAEYLAALDRSDVVMQVKTKLIEQLSRGEVTEENVASAINMSRRSLQRKLKDKGVTYKELLDGTRSDLAKEYIRNTRLSINEITYMLGFTEPSNFTRAFKRWTGYAPSEFRALN